MFMAFPTAEWDVFIVQGLDPFFISMADTDLFRESS